MTAALTTLPVFGVPVESKALTGHGLALLSIVQMPAGVPVGTLAIGRGRRDQCRAAGGQRPGPAGSALAERLEAWRKRQTEAVADNPEDGA